MLTEQEERVISEQITLYPTKRAVIPEALMIVQQRKGWVADEDVEDIAAFLEMSTVEIDSIASFYNLIYRRPVGRHVILLCDSVSCWIMGYQAIHDYLRTQLGISPGETTPDQRFTLLPSVCLGACDHAPALMIDGDLLTELTPEKLAALLTHYE